MAANLAALFADLIIKWNLDTYILLRIRVIMGFLIFLYYVTFNFSGALLYYPARAPTASILDAVSDTILVYVMGAMQAAPFKNQMFPIWAILLISYRSTVNFMSKYDTYFELTNMLKLWAAALLNVKHGSKSLRAPFWLFWSILVVKSLYRIRSRKLASQSLWHGRSSELVREYMGAVDHKESNFSPDTLEGCKYLVYGESKKNIAKRLSPSINDLKYIIALDKIWLHDGLPLLRTLNKHKNTIKDLTLAFALSRLLRCRMDGVRLHEDTISMTKELICSRIIRRDDKADSILGGILLMDLSFLSQHIHTGHPMVFCQGLRSLCFPALQCVVQLTCSVWLLVDITPHHNADKYITGAAVLLILAMVLCEVVGYMSSSWTLVLLVCNYVNCSTNKLMEYVFERMVSGAPLITQGGLLVLFTSRYDFLQSSNYSEGKLRLGPFRHPLLAQFTSNTRSHPVVTAVIRALARYMDGESSPLPRHCLPSPRVSDRAQRYWSACLELPSCSHVILVWHIATSLCQVKHKQDRGDTKGLFRLFARNTMPDLATNLSKANMVANCLSRYCLYLLISRPNLLPENIFASKKLLLDTIQHAHDILRGCKSPQRRYDELIAQVSHEGDVHAGSRQDIKLTGNILIQGAMMGKELIDSEDEEGRWEILAEVWADIVVQIAPSSKAEAHGNALQFFAELVTIIWALLCHCGIEKSELWPEER